MSLRKTILAAWAGSPAPGGRPWGLYPVPVALRQLVGDQAGGRRLAREPAHSAGWYNPGEAASLPQAKDPFILMWIWRE